MRPMTRAALFLIITGMLFCIGGTVHAGALHGPWNELLGRYVVDGEVDYSGFKQAEPELDRYLALLGETDPGQLADMDRLAFYINAYNAYTVKLILDNFTNGKPVESIRKIGGIFKSPWDIRFAVVGGQRYSLDNIEHDIIRRQFTEPRIHFAVNCASRSCPKLISEAYQGDMLDAQLEAGTRAFLEDSAHNYLDGTTLHVSSIFKWYSEDFPEGPVAFFIDHVSSGFRDELEMVGDTIEVRYLKYDWSLNSVRR